MEDLIELRTLSHYQFTVTCTCCKKEVKGNVEIENPLNFFKDN